MKVLLALFVCAVVVASLVLVSADSHMPPLPSTGDEKQAQQKQLGTEKAPLKDKALCAKEASKAQKECKRTNKDTRKVCLDAAKILRATNKTEARLAVKACTQTFNVAEKQCKVAFKESTKQCKAL